LIRTATADDADAIAGIYNPYVLDTVVTFEEEAVSAAAIATRIADVTTASLPWLVAERDGALQGYAYATRWKGRCSFRYSVETTVYLATGSTGRGMGKQLYGELLRRLQERGMHVAIGGIALPNAASVALHEKLGFHKVGHFSEVGFKFGRWVDVGYWQRTL
jgi:L-amino acid N-acyltransferase YncA